MTEKKSIETAGVDRRTMLKGAAWATPVIAAAVATPLAAATTPSPSIRIFGDCLLNVIGVKIGQGFYVENQGSGPYADNITVVETIRLTGLAAAPLIRGAIWALLAVQGVIGGAGSGVVLGNWSIVNSGTLLNPVSTATRTVTITGPLAAGQVRSWGQLADAVAGVIDLVSITGLASISQTATITSPTGNPPVTQASDSLNWELISSSC